MSLHALIPIKQLSYSKSRLSHLLTLNERSDLVIQMFTHVYQTLIGVSAISSIHVVSSDTKISDLTKQMGIQLFPDSQKGLNMALSQSASNFKKQHTSLLTLSSDLPYITKDDILSLVVLSKKYPLVIGPSKDNGTNAILSTPPLLIPYQMGKNSFSKHKQYADKQKIPYGIYKSETLERDIDTPSDYLALKNPIAT